MTDHLPDIFRSLVTTTPRSRRSRTTGQSRDQGSPSKRPIPTASQAAHRRSRVPGHQHPRPSRRDWERVG